MARDCRGKVRRASERGEEESLPPDWEQTVRQRTHDHTRERRSRSGEKGTTSPRTLLTSRFITKRGEREAFPEEGQWCGGNTPAVTLVATRNKLTLKKGGSRFVPPSIGNASGRRGPCLSCRCGAAQASWHRHPRAPSSCSGCPWYRRSCRPSWPWTRAAPGSP